MKIQKNRGLYYLVNINPEEAQELFNKETLTSILMINFISPTTNVYCDSTQCITGCIHNNNETDKNTER